MIKKMKMVYKITLPFVKLLTKSTSLISKIFGVEFLYMKIIIPKHVKMVSKEVFIGYF